MRCCIPFAIILLATPLLVGAQFQDISIREALERPEKDIRYARITGYVTATIGNLFVVSDKTNAMAICRFRSDTAKIACGDLISVDTKIRCTLNIPYAHAIRIVTRGNRTCNPRHVSIQELYSGRCDLQPIVFEGTITDAFVDENDPSYTFLTIEADGSTAFVSFHATPADIGKWSALINTVVSVSGICVPDLSGPRRYLSHLVSVDPTSGIRPLSDAECPTVTRFPRRQELKGVVLSFCDHKAFYLRTDSGHRLKVYPSRDSTTPPVGATVSASGFVRKNIYFDFLFNAQVTQLGDKIVQSEIPKDITPHDLLFDSSGQPMIKPSCEGRAIRFNGIVRNSTGAEAADRTMTLDCNGISVCVRIGSMAPPPIGSLVSVSGICSISTESDGMANGFLRLTGFKLLTRSAADIVILARPSWWTPLRLFVLALSLLAFLLGSVVWNILLKRKSEQRGRELYEEKIDHALAEQKVEERTRLAVELHDSVSQTLTGVALQLDGGVVETAKTMLASCRGELRRCLWDLRSRTFEEKDMTEAVTRTITPHLNGVEATVRFNVPRERLSESLTHAILRIIRELVVNAIRHGQAKHIRIAGEMHENTVSFSVTDDGCGFAPETAPGPEQGHFGLLGIRERIEDFNGTLKIASAPEKGAKFTVTLLATDETNEQ